MNRDEFLRERNEALLSLDEEKIRAYANKCGAALPDEPEVFWRAVHKAITAITTFPDDVRLKSKRWLESRGSHSWDDLGERMKSVNKLTYEIAESREYRGHWHVEAIDDEGRIFVAVFSGPEAEKRATEYADWKSGVRHPASVLELVKVNRDYRD